MKLTVTCPAKINTFLAVGPPDAESGWHPLRTIFQAISLTDELVVEAADQDELICDWPELPPENTLTKAVSLLRQLVEFPPLRLTLTKQIPHQSGLGGGSSDAAGVIRAIRRIVGPDLTEAEMHRIALKVGADVPFFLVGGRARAEGYGEKLTPLDDQPRGWLVIAKPNCGVSTVEAYRALDAQERPWLHFPAGDELHNDFEPAAPPECRHLTRRLLNLGAKDAQLSGSGSAVFGRFENETLAETGAENLRRECGQVWIAHTLTRGESLWMS